MKQGWNSEACCVDRAFEECYSMSIGKFCVMSL